jgi:hypothetical protein
MQQQGFQTIAGMGTQSPLINQAMQQQSDVMGQNAINNPLLGQYYQAAADPMIQNYMSATAPGINASALKAGAFGGSGHAATVASGQEGLGRGLAALGAQIYEPAWQQQEQMKQQAAYMSPYLQQAQYMPAQMMMQAGGAQQQQQQNVLNALYQNQYGAANWPYQVLQMLGQGVGQAMGGTGGVTTIQTKAS